MGGGRGRGGSIRRRQEIAGVTGRDRGEGGGERGRLEVSYQDNNDQKRATEEPRPGAVMTDSDGPLWRCEAAPPEDT